MAQATIKVNVDGSMLQELTLGYELIGPSGGRPWAITPGGRFSRHYAGIREMAEELAKLGNQVVIWDRPNCGESDVCFVGATESGMQADALAALLTHLGLRDAVLVGGSGGARLSLLAIARHPDVVAATAVWWLTGGVYGLMKVGTNYGGESPRAAWKGGMEAVIELAEWEEVLEKNPSNRDRFLAQDPKAFIETIERWMLAHCPCGGALVPGLPDTELAAITAPALVFRSARKDPVHTRAASESLAALLPSSTAMDLPWPDADPLDAGSGRLFLQWPTLAPILHDWAISALA